jgi:hypothetical protein
MVKTNFDGHPQESGCSLLAPSTMSLLVTMTLFSLGRVFGGLSFPDCEVACAWAILGDA